MQSLPCGKTPAQWLGLFATCLAVAGVLGDITIKLSGQAAPPNQEWRTYAADLANTHYSPLDQINKDNFGKLEVAWRFKADALGPRPEYNWESTPLMANGMIYVTAGTRRAVVGLMPRPARCCGCTRNTRGRAVNRRRANSPAAASPTGPTARAIAGCSTSRPATSSSR